MREPTTKQQDVLDYLQAANRSGRPTPCVREMCDHFGLASTRAMCDRLDALEKKGMIRRERGKARAIHLIDGRRVRAHKSTETDPVPRTPD